MPHAVRGNGRIIVLKHVPRKQRGYRLNASVFPAFGRVMERICVFKVYTHIRFTQGERRTNRVYA